MNELIAVIAVFCLVMTAAGVHWATERDSIHQTREAQASTTLDSDDEDTFYMRAAQPSDGFLEKEDGTICRADGTKCGEIDPMEVARTVASWTWGDQHGQCLVVARSLARVVESLVARVDALEGEQ